MFHASLSCFRGFNGFWSVLVPVLSCLKGFRQVLNGLDSNRTVFLRVLGKFIVF